MSGPNARAVLIAFLLAFGAPSGAHDAQSPPEQLGKVSFPSSCQPAVQASLERGVALLHSFWFSEGERAFREVLARDPACAIAEWGIATALMGNPFGSGANPSGVQRAKEAIERGRAGGRKTERERYFIEAVAEYFDQFAARTHMQRLKPLSAAFEAIARRFPEDDEAQIFSAVYLTATQSLTDQSYAAALKAASILEVQFRKYPQHPGVAHYLIHSYDFPAIAEKGIDAAKRYAQIAPSAPHALHMIHFARAVGAARSGDTEAARKDAEELGRLRDALAARKDAYWTEQVEIQRLAAQAWIELAQGRHEAALALMRQSADRQDASEKATVTPGHLAPSRELLGEMLLELNQPGQALKEFEASAVGNPNRFRGTFGAALAAAQARDGTKARTYYARLLELAGKGDSRPELQQARTWLARK